MNIRMKRLCFHLVIFVVTSEKAWPPSLDMTELIAVQCSVTVQSNSVNVARVTVCLTPDCCQDMLLLVLLV